MNIEVKYLIALVLVSMMTGGAITAKFVSNREVIKTETVEHTTVQNHIVTVVKEVNRPDGTKEITTTKDDNSVKNDSYKTDTVDVKPALAPNWMVSGGAGLSLNGVPGMVYQVGVARRVIGPIFVQAWGYTGHDTAGGLSAVIEF